ncbi:hypothetical protein AE923_19585 [Xanthomonas arboricola]|nr:hypothetical protein AE923_19585 [Xanthomonas arboricola]
MLRFALVTSFPRDFRSRLMRDSVGYGFHVRRFLVPVAIRQDRRFVLAGGLFTRQVCRAHLHEQPASQSACGVKERRVAAQPVATGAARSRRRGHGSPQRSLAR